jgi:DNA ligase 1
MNVLVSALLEGGIELMQKRCTVTPGTALKPMLAKVACGIADAVSKLRKKAEDPHAPLRLLCEYKYDGVRSMVHIRGPPSHAQEQGADAGGGERGGGGGGARPVMIFSRNCEDKTNSFPDVVEMLQLLVGRRQMVLDAEIVAIDRSTRALLPFQQLSTRARVSASALDDKQLRKEDVTVTVCVFLFDLLFLDDRPLLQEPLQERRRLLAQALPAAAKGEMPGVIEMARSVELCIPGVGGGTAACRNGGKAGGGAAGAKSGRGETDEALETEQERLKEEVRGQAALMEALDAQCEGLMMKDLDGGYRPGKRADCWLKVKKDYVEGLADSFDLVPIGAWHGSGRKAGWYSPFLMAVHDPETGELQSLCRVMSGFTDAFYKAATARLGAKTIVTPPSYYVTGESPSVWFEADEVWEIRGAELTASPVHMAGGGRGGTGGRGLALRFPRFLSIREDKNVEDATNPDHVLSLFHKQSNRSAPPPQASATGSVFSDDDQDDAAAAVSDSDGSDDAAL